MGEESGGYTVASPSWLACYVGVAFLGGLVEVEIVEAVVCKRFGKDGG